MRTQRLQDAVNDKAVLTPPRKKMRGEVVEISKGIGKLPPSKYTPTVGVEGVQVIVKVISAKHATDIGQASCRRMGGCVGLGLVEICASFTLVEQERRCSEI